MVCYLCRSFKTRILYWSWASLLVFLFNSTSLYCEVLFILKSLLNLGNVCQNIVAWLLQNKTLRLMIHLLMPLLAVAWYFVSLFCPCLLSFSVEIYVRMSTDLLPTPAKSHYVFNLRDLSKCIQGWSASHNTVTWLWHIKNQSTISVTWAIPNILTWVTLVIISKIFIIRFVLIYPLSFLLRCTSGRSWSYSRRWTDFSPVLSRGTKSLSRSSH